MEILKINMELLSILLFLAPGYLGFRLYQIDQPWSSFNAIDIIYGSLIFSTASYLTYQMLILIGFRDNQFLLVESLLLFSPIYGLSWRIFGHEYLHKALRHLRITNEDNTDTAWTRIFNNPQIYLSQIIVHMKDGSQMWCDDTKVYHRQDFDRLGVHPYYSDPAGNIYVICTHYRAASTTEWEEISELYCPPPWGIKLSLIPASEIARIEARVTESGKVSAA